MSCNCGIGSPELDDALGSGMSTRKTGAKFGYDRNRIARHAKFCLRMKHGAMPDAARKLAIAKHSRLESDLSAALEAALSLKKRAEETNDMKMLVAAQRLVSRALAMQQRATPKVPAEVTINETARGPRLNFEQCRVGFKYPEGTDEELVNRFQAKERPDLPATAPTVLAHSMD